MSMNSKTKILIGIFVVGILLISGWLAWSNQKKPSITTDKTEYSTDELITFRIENRLEQSIYLNPVFSIMVETLTEDKAWIPTRTTGFMPCACFPEVKCDEKRFSHMNEIKRSEPYYSVIIRECFHYSSENFGRYRLEVKFFDDKMSMGSSSPVIYSNEFIVKSNNGTKIEKGISDYVQETTPKKITKDSNSLYLEKEKLKIANGI